MSIVPEDALMIGDGNFFFNLRPVRHYSERVSFGSSLLANFILTALLLLEKNRMIKPYSRVLLLNAVFDYVYTFVSFAIEMVSWHEAGHSLVHLRFKIQLRKLSVISQRFFSLLMAV